MIRTNSRFIGTIELSADSQTNPRTIVTYIVKPVPPDIPEDLLMPMDTCDVFSQGISLEKQEACSFSSQEDMINSQNAWLGLIKRYSSDFVHSLLFRLIQRG